jgi:deazaflavin-dependent oxidoreductase (nitroreductase family)
MTTLNPRTEERLRQGFKRYLNPFMLTMWRLGLGPFINIWPEVGGRIMVIAHRGRKSGLRRYAPVNYALVDGEIYCTAGFGRLSDWYCNVMINPNVEVWLPDGWWAGVVEDISDSPKRLPLLRQVLVGSGVVAPMFGMDPIRMTDEQLHAATSQYPLLHIWRTEARTGRGGPGDLAWVWPLATLATMMLLPLAFRRRSKIVSRRRKGK